MRIVFSNWGVHIGIWNVRSVQALIRVDKRYELRINFHNGQWIDISFLRMKIKFGLRIKYYKMNKIDELRYSL